MEFDYLVTLIERFGWDGVVLAGIILALIFGARLLGLVQKGKESKWANLVLGAVLSGTISNPNGQNVIEWALLSLGAAGAYEGVRFLAKKISPAV